MTVEFTFFRQVIRFSIVAALVYCIPVFFFIRQMAYEETFILYIGNFLFAAVIAIFISWFYKKHESSIGTVRLVVIGGKAAVAGIVAACLFILLLLIIMQPGVFSATPSPASILKDAPGQISGKNQGFGKILFLNAILANAGASFFISLLVPFSVMKNLYPDEREKNKTPKEENPKKNYHL